MKVSSRSLPSSSLCVKTHLGLPCRFIEREVQDERDPPCTDHIIVVQEVTSLRVLCATHVGLATAQGSTSRDLLEELAERFRVECIAEFEEGREESEFGSG